MKILSSNIFILFCSILLIFHDTQIWHKFACTFIQEFYYNFFFIFNNWHTLEIFVNMGCISFHKIKGLRISNDILKRKMWCFKPVLICVMYFTTALHSFFREPFCVMACAFFGVSTHECSSASQVKLSITHNCIRCVMLISLVVH